MANYGSPIESRYDVNPENGCWEWNASNSGGGPGNCYGTLNREGHYKAHRYMYEKKVGPIPEGHEVMHKCDNTLCVNPEHLMTGTHQDNMEDKVRKGRCALNRGVENAAAKLTPAKVREVRASLSRGEQCASLGRKYGVSEVAIGLIKRGKTWRHVA